MAFGARCLSRLREGAMLSGKKRRSDLRRGVSGD
jgi:hypothetical protein